jgi:hypothetical protein
VTEPADFTEAAYRELLLAARDRMQFLDSFKADGRAGVAIWRHDIDMSPHRALRLAQIESELSLPCHYFVMFGSMFYNAFEPRVSAMLRDIVKLGHGVGLHFDASVYPASNRDQMEQALAQEAGMLASLLGCPLTSFSLHNPTVSATVKLEDATHAGLVNASSPSLVGSFTYCSDSNGIWRHRRLHDVLVDPAVSRVYALTHPEWWPPEAMSPRQRIQRCIDGRSQRVGADYDRALAALGRFNQ